MHLLHCLHNEGNVLYILFPYSTHGNWKILFPDSYFSFTSLTFLSDFFLYFQLVLMELTKYGLEEQALWWLKMDRTDKLRRLLLLGLLSGQQLVASLRRQHLVQLSSTSSLMIWKPEQSAALVGVR